MTVSHNSRILLLYSISYIYLYHRKGRVRSMASHRGKPKEEINKYVSDCMRINDLATGKELSIIAPQLTARPPTSCHGHTCLLLGEAFTPSQHERHAQLHSIVGIYIGREKRPRSVGVSINTHQPENGRLIPLAGPMARRSFYLRNVYHCNILLLSCLSSCLYLLIHWATILEDQNTSGFFLEFIYEYTSGGPYDNFYT